MVDRYMEVVGDRVLINRRCICNKYCASICKSAKILIVIDDHKIVTGAG